MRMNVLQGSSIKGLSTVGRKSHKRLQHQPLFKNSPWLSPAYKNLQAPGKNSMTISSSSGTQDCARAFGFPLSTHAKNTPTRRAQAVSKENQRGKGQGVGWTYLEEKKISTTDGPFPSQHSYCCDG